MTRILGMAAASARLQIHPCTLKAWADKGAVEHVRDSAGRRLFDATVIEKMVRERRKRAKREVAA